MDGHFIAALISSALVLASISFYIRDIIWGTTRPNLVSQSLWFLLGSITVGAQLSAGASLSVLLPIVSLFCIGIIIALIFRGYGHKEYRTLDGVCFVSALFTLLLWYFTAEPRLAILLSVTTSFIAVLPTIMKTYRDPLSEHAFAWLLTFLAAICSLFSIRAFDIANVAYPLYVLIESGIVTIFAYVGKRHWSV